MIGGLQRRYPGLRPVGFFSPYEAAAWVVIGHRIRIAQAAAVKQRIAAEYGETVDIDGVPATAFPAPDRLRSLGAVRGLTEKVARLRGIAEAAVRGELDGAALRACDPAEALFAPLGFQEMMRFPRDASVVVGLSGPDGCPHFWLGPTALRAGREVHNVEAVHHGFPESPPREFAASARVSTGDRDR